MLRKSWKSGLPDKNLFEVVYSTEGPKGKLDHVLSKIGGSCGFWTFSGFYFIKRLNFKAIKKFSVFSITS